MLYRTIIAQKWLTAGATLVEKKTLLSSLNGTDLSYTELVVDPNCEAKSYRSAYASATVVFTNTYERYTSCTCAYIRYSRRLIYGWIVFLQRKKNGPKWKGMELQLAI